MGRNHAVRVNGFVNQSGAVDNHITQCGSSWLFAVCALMGLTALICVGWSATKHRRQRLFFYICALINFVSTISYFAMGSNLGWAAIPVQFRRSNPKVGGLVRQIFYARYIDWAITTPLLLLALLLTCAVPWPTILYTLALGEIMVVTSLIGALIPTRYKWGFVVFGGAALLFLLYNILIEGRSYARSLGADVHRTYTILAAYLMFLWLLYPIAWGLSEGGNVISLDSEHIFYGILDLLSKPVFSILLLWLHRNIDVGRLGIHIRDADDAPRGIRPNDSYDDKGHHGGAPHNGVHGVATASNPHSGVV